MRKYILRLTGVIMVVFSLFALCIGKCDAQTLNMPVIGHGDTTVSSITVYDDGGPDSNYGSRVNSSYTFRTSTPGHRFRIKVYSDIYKSGVSLAIYNGDSARDDDTYLFKTRFYDERAQYFYSDSDAVTVVFVSDDDDPTAGFEIDICETGDIEPPTNLRTEFIDSSTVLIMWDETDNNVNWGIDYADAYNYTYKTHFVLADTNVTTHTVYSDTNFVVITGLQHVLFYVVYAMDSTPCGQGTIGSYCPCAEIVNINAHYDPDSLRITWTPGRQAPYWDIEGYSPYYFRTTVYDTVLTLPYSCDNAYGGSYVFINGGGCLLDNATCNYYILNIDNSPCRNASNIYQVDVSATSIVASWYTYNYYDTIPAYVVAYREAFLPEDSNIVWDTVFRGEETDTLMHGTPTEWWLWIYYMDTITGLKPNTPYIVTIYSLCDNGTMSCGQSRNFVTTLDNCVDYTNILDLNRVSLTAGTYDNPFATRDLADEYGYYPTNGLSFYNYNNYYMGNMDFASSYYSVYTDTNTFDWYTYNYNSTTMLRCVPPGDVASIRLGDAVPGDAETITFDYYVDTTAYDLLVLRYAIVMQNPGHTRENQPHFTMQILDSAGMLIDSTCCYADFFAADSLDGWNTSQESIIWKDWTTVGIDIAPYHGQEIKIRLINKDCAEGGHFSYAYFTIHCDNKRIILVNRCDADDSIHLVAPQGFDYQWFRADNPSVVLGTSADLLAPTDTNVYTVRCSFVGKHACYFDISTKTIDIYPVARYHSLVDTCNQRAYLFSDAYLEFDTSYKAYTNQMIDSSFWIMEDGTVRQGDTLTFDLLENRTYITCLHAQLSNSYCNSTLCDSIVVNFAYSKGIVGDSVVCQGDTLALDAVITPLNATTYHWDNGDTTMRMLCVPTTADTLFRVALGYNNCHDTLQHRVRVNSVSNDTVAVRICQGDIYGEGFNTSDAGYHTHYAASATTGCDSLYTISLSVDSTRFALFRDTICEGRSYAFGTLVCSVPGTYTDTIASYTGCDSIRTLFLHQKPITRDTTHDHFCEGNSYTFENSTYYAAGTYQRILTNVAGCDSVRTLYLTMVDTTVTRSDVFICSNESYVWNGVELTAPGTYVITGENVDHCDSVAMLTLTVGHTFNGIIHTAICEGDSILFEGVHYTTPGQYSVMLTTTQGCDSIRNLDLAIIPQARSLAHDTVCHGALVPWGMHAYTETGVYGDTIRTPSGCDSIALLDLLVFPTYSNNISADICEGDTYPFAGYDRGQSGVYIDSNITVNLCDSVTTLVLAIHQSYIDTFYATISAGDTYHGHGFTLTEGGTYVHDLTSRYGCDSVTVMILNILASIDGMEENCRLVVFPNPTQGLLTVAAEGMAGETHVAVFDATGRRLLTSNADMRDGDTITIDISPFPAGHYILQITTPSGLTTTRIVKL